MSGVTLLRAADRGPQPWKNGGGETRDVLVQPPGSDMDGFDWRVSIAKVDREGPFSVFAGVERVLTVLEGQLDLEIAGKRFMLDARAAPLVFSGEAPAVGRPVAGAVHDLNVMTRRGSARVTRESVTTRRRFAAEAGTQLLIVALDPLLAEVDDAEVRLAPRDAILLTVGSDVGLSAPNGGDILIVRHQMPCLERPMTGGRKNTVMNQNGIKPSRGCKISSQNPCGAYPG